MIKLFLHAVLIAFISINYSSNLLAQTISDKVQFSWGEEISTPRNSLLMDVFAVTDGYFYAYRRVKNDPVIEKYDSKCNQIKSLELDLKSASKRNKNVLKFWHTTDKIFLFSDYEEPQKNEHILTVQTVNGNTLNPNTDVKQIAMMDNSQGFKWDSGIFQFTQSPDSSYILVYFETPKLRGEYQEIGLQVYDQNMNVKWESLVSLPYKEELFRPDDFKVSNDGKVYILGSLYKDKLKNRVKGKPNYAPRILCFGDGGLLEFNYDLKMGNLFLVDKSLSINDQNDIICAGFYSDEGKLAINGVFSVVIDGKSLEIKNSSSKPFDLDMVVDGLRKNETKDPQMMKYILRDLLSRNDGGYSLIGEQYYTTESQKSDGNGGTYSVTNYIYRSIVVIDFEKNGDVKWATKIVKYQKSSSDGGYYSSFATSLAGDHLYLIYNDNIENVGIKEGEPRKMFYNGRKGASVTLIDIGPDGEFTREAIITSNKDEVITVPKVCIQTSPNEMLFFGDRKKTQKFAILKFK